MTGARALSILGIEEGHRREEFDCGEEALNSYLRRYARQNHERNIARTFVAVDQDDRVLGYYSLASASIEFASLPADLAKRVPRCPVPAYSHYWQKVRRGRETLSFVDALAA